MRSRVDNLEALSGRVDTVEEGIEALQAEINTTAGEVADLSAQNSSFLARLGGLLIRVIFVIVLGIGLGAAAYFGVTALYSQFVQPAQEHNLRLNALEENFEETSQRQSRRMEELATRLDTLEMQGDARKGTLFDLQTQQSGLEETHSAQATLVVTAVEAVNSLQADMADLHSETENIQGNLDTLEAQVQAMETDLAAAGNSIDNIIDQAGENAEN